MEKYVVCYSGGHSSALVAIEAVKKYGKNNVILLNHDISSKVEHADIKRFKRDVSDYLDVDITQANALDFEEMTPCQVAVRKKAFQVDKQPMFCTSYLKTEPFYKWLNENYPADFENPNINIKILYGFDNNERHRIQRRSTILGAMGYYTDYPLAFWERTIDKTENIGIQRPATYRIYKHANCIGCHKAGWQHWYCVYCMRPDIWEEAKQAESKIGYSIHDEYLIDREEEFKEMKEEKGICPNDKMDHQTFWAKVREKLPGQMDMFPCECSI